MVTIWFRNIEGYLRYTIHICETCHARTLSLLLCGSVNVPILVCLMIIPASVVIPQRVSYKNFIIMLMVNGNNPTLIGSL